MAHYIIDTTHSAAQFKVRHMMIANVKGEFSKVSGTVSFDPADPTAATVEATLDVSTINTRDPQRDQHLKSEEFFNAEKHPQITFKSKKVTGSTENSYDLTGDLTIRGVTKEVTLKVKDFTEEIKDPAGQMRRGASAKTHINRRDFGMLFNVALEAGGFLVGEDVDINLDVELIREA